MDLNSIWFILVGILFAGYVILDGFDLGVGILYLFSKEDHHRRLMLNAIGPVWDGNEVWLVTGGGALFAAFPEVYATVYSGFYNLFMLLLLGLIFRAIAIEFRSKEPWAWWRKMWDVGFALGSLVSTFIIGIIVGNIALGINLNEHHQFVGSFSSLLNPYALCLGITTVALFTMHASIYLSMKIEGPFHKQIKSWINPSIVVFIVLYFITNVLTFIYCKHITNEILTQRRYLVFILALNILAVLNIPRCIHLGRNFRAFLFSCLSIIFLLTLLGLSMYPRMIFSSPELAHSLDIINGASSQQTLKIMLIIAIIGAPLVLSYTISVYWIFRGKVKITEDSY